MSGKSIEDKIEEANRDNPLLQFLGKENVEDMKKRIVDVIVEQVRDDMHDYREYLINPDDIVECLMDDTIGRVRDRVQEKLEKAVMERAMKKLGLDVSEVGEKEWEYLKIMCHEIYFVVCQMMSYRNVIEADGQV